MLCNYLMLTCVVTFPAIPYIGGTTALHLATQANHIDCIRELILNGADYNATDEKGRTSLYIAAESGLEEAVLCHLKNAVGRDILSLPVKETGECFNLQCFHDLIKKLWLVFWQERRHCIAV